ncbi:hypothetical protein Poly51_10090 [Rubripirellula tenax]|uniref:Uncharacterized protein n=1 Tax=Rubripirellula tenax TaxID=2528015 RepID=A0A5C6FH10_9BACT|nr:hypothetical protein [Rubripirellula tenax]TWU60728.1 hypothetical protein Poly51_10090 [Rubripirellula tenax]
MIDRQTKDLRDFGWLAQAWPIPLMGLFVLLTTGCGSLLTPHQATYQYDPCQCLGSCAGYTETNWTSLDGCRGEPSTPHPRVPVEEYFPVSKVAPNNDELLLNEATVVGKAILMKEASEAAKEVSRRLASEEGQEVIQAGYFSRSTQQETNASQWQTAPRGAESTFEKPEADEDRIDKNRHDKQLVEVTVEYLQ